MAITDLDEQRLVKAHQAGDEHAFQHIVRSQHRALYAHAFRRLGSHEAAEDAVQDTLLRAYRALPSFDGDLRLRAWLHRILTNVCHDEGNRRRRESGLIEKLESEPVELVPDPIEETVLHDTVRIMNEALAELPETYREALVLRYVDGLSFREVAELTGVTEENARARVHRGRQALHKVLSRVAVMVAFLVPGLRRAQTAPADGAVAASASSEPTLSLATQLTSHAINMAPALSRVADVAVATSGTKSSMVATAVAAAVAVAAPVAAYKVYDTTSTPDRPPAATAAPADEEPSTFTSTSLDVAGAQGATTSSTPETTTSLPSSAVAPFAGAAPVEDEQGEATTGTTAAPTTTTTTTAPPPEAVVVEGTLGGDAFEVLGARPDFDVSGRTILDGSGDPVAGVLAGGFYIADALGGDADAELTFTLDDGRALRVRFSGTLDAEEVADGATTWTMSGQYKVEGGESVGVAEIGTASVVFRHVDGAPSSIAFDLRGHQATDS